MKKPIIAIWDIDKTLYEGYVIIDFGKYLEEVGMFKSGFASEIDELKSKYENKSISYNDFALGVYKIYGNYLFNHNRYEVMQVSKDFWKQGITKLYPVSKTIYDYLQSIGSDHAAISGSSFESLYYLLDILNFSKMKSTEYEVIDGNFTTKLVSTLVSHSDKSKLQERVLNQRNKYDLTIGLGDNHADVSFLQYVDIPIIIGNSDGELVKWGNENNALIFADPKATDIDLSELITRIEQRSAPQP
jgi:phosphoserine phosphatase